MWVLLGCLRMGEINWFGCPCVRVCAAPPILSAVSAVANIPVSVLGDGDEHLHHSLFSRSINSRVGNITRTDTVSSHVDIEPWSVGSRGGMVV
jgi:hypothetical protein